MIYKKPRYSDPKAYSGGYDKGYELALAGKKINYRLMSSFKALFLSAYADSFCEGMRDGYRQGLWDKGKGLQRLRNKEIDGILKRKKQKNDISRER